MQPIVNSIIMLVLDIEKVLRCKFLEMLTGGGKTLRYKHHEEGFQRVQAHS